MLQLRAIAELKLGQSEKALDDIKLALRLADSIRTEPILISHLVRIAMVNITLQPIWEGLAEHKWSELQLVALDEELAKMDFLADGLKAQNSEFFSEKEKSKIWRGFQDKVRNFYAQHPEDSL